VIGALDGTPPPRLLQTYFLRLVEMLAWLSFATRLLAILIGAARFAIAFLPYEFTRDGAWVTRLHRSGIELRRYIQAGLEVFIVSYIIHTALSLNLGDLLFLGMLVVILSVISFFLECEIRGLSLQASG
jgi:uncharacterized membrane protein